MNAAVKFIHQLVSRRPVQTVDILGDNASKLPRPFQLSQFQMGAVGLCIGMHHVFPIEFKKALRI